MITQDEMSIALSQINYWISCKNMGRFDEVKEEIEAKDYSAMAISIRMAKEMLLENYEMAIPLLDQALSSSMSSNAVETWPLFIQFRKTEHYKEFQRKYAKELEHQIIDSEDLTESRGSDKADELHDLKRTFKEDAEETKENATELPQTIVT